MSRRAGDWHLLGVDSDPVPASYVDVDAVADEYEDRGASLREAYSALTKLADLDGWRGDAAEAFAETADDVLGDLEKATEKYEDAGKALRTYANDVLEARTKTWEALQDAEDADSRRRANDGDPLQGIDDPTPEQVDGAQAQSSRHTTAVNDLTAARAKLQTALSALDTAATACANKIKKASDKFKDRRFLDDFVSKFADQIDGIVEALKWVALGIAAVGLAIAIFATAPIWGTIATVLLVVGAVVGVAILAGEVMLVAAGTGKASWTDVGMAVLGLVTLGFGTAAIRGVTKAVPGILAATGSRGQAAVQAAARANLPQNGRNALNISNAANPLRVWAQTSMDDLARPGLAAIDDALTRIPTNLQRVAALDGDLATALGRIRALQGLNITGSADDLARALELTRRAIGANVADVTVNLESLADKNGLSPMPWVNQELEQLQWRLSRIGR